MKKTFKTLIASIVLLLSFTNSKAHTLTKVSWCGGSFTINATIGSPDGKIEVTVYTNSSMTTVVPQIGGIAPNYTITYTLNSNGAKTFTVPQSSINTVVYVKVKWFKKQGNTYVIDPWSGNSSATNYTLTGTNLSIGCTTLAVRSIKIIDAINIKNTTIIHFKAESDTDNEILTINYIMPDQSSKSIKIVFWTMLKLEDTWEVIIDNVTNKVISVKNKK